MKCPHCNGTGELTGDEVHFGALICAVRKARGWTQQELADAMHMSRGQIANVEVGRSDIPLKTLARFAEALKCTMKDLVP